MLKTNLDSLRLLTEQFKLIRDLLQAPSAVQAKAALILLDSIADTLMYDVALREFDCQSSLASIQRPRYDPGRRDKIRRDFGAKLTVVRDLDLITNQNATVLRIGHSYRNAAYHRDTHNPRVTGLITRVLLLTTMQLYVDYFDNGISVGGVNEPWLAVYGIKGSLFSFAGVSSAVAVTLTKGMNMPLAELRAALEEDIRERVTAIEQRITSLAIPSPDALDDGLKRAEFDQKFPKEIFFAELHELHYKIVAGDSKDLTRMQYVEAEEAAHIRLNSALIDFTPTASLATLQAIKNSHRLGKARNVAALLLGYEDSDSKLNTLESALDSVEEALDRAAEHLENLRRGK